MSSKAIAWFAGRGISKKTLEQMRVTEGMEWMPQKNGQANTIQFNYYRRGELVNTKFRTGDKCFKMVSGAELLPYNIDAIKGQKECIITEGEMDALSFIECGRTDVVSVPNGANANLSYLDDYIEEYSTTKIRFSSHRTPTPKALSYGTSCYGVSELTAVAFSNMGRDARTPTSI